MNSDLLLFCLQHHKCGSTTFHEFFSYLCALTGRKSGCNSYPQLALGEFCKKHRFSGASSRQSKPWQLNDIENFRAIHVVRDPRDLLVSAYFSHRNSHPTEGWKDMQIAREVLPRLSLEEGLLWDLEMPTTKATLQDLNDWPVGHDKRILDVKLEKFAESPSETIDDILNHFEIRTYDHAYKLGEATERWNIFASKNRVLSRLGLRTAKVSKRQTRYLKENYTFKSQSGGRDVGEENRDSHYRKGKSGDWKNYFFPELQQKFEERYPLILEKYNYPKF